MPTPIKRKTWITNSPIKERQTFRVIKRIPDTRVKGIKIDGKEFRFGQGNSFTVDDPGLAHAIHDNQGQGGDGDVLVVPTEKRIKPGTVRTWLGVKLPWHTDDHKFGESSR